MRFSRLLFMVGLVLVTFQTAPASPPTTINYQGRVTNNGSPIPNGSYSIRFSLWTDAAGGSESWSETQMVTVTDGLFSTELGATEPFFDVCPNVGCDDWLQIQVTVGGALQTMSPRTHLSATPWSLVSTSVYAEDTNGTSMARGIMTSKPGSTGGTASSHALLDADSDGDGLAESELSQDVTTTSSKLAIKTKGTSAHRVAAETYPDSGVLVIESDPDGSGPSFARGIVTTKPTSGTAGGTTFAALRSSLAGEYVRSAFTALADSGSVETFGDSDGDGPAFSRGIVTTKPGSGSTGGSTHLRAINTTGTGATVRVGMEASDSGSVESSIDEDGDGAAEARGIVTTKPSGGTTGGSKGRIAAESDGDEDGVPDLIAETLVDEDSATIHLSAFPSGAPAQTIAMTATPTDVHVQVGLATCDGSDWINASDRNAKENFEAIDGAALLAQVEALPIAKWNYKQDDESVKHIGPTAQDFKSAFGVGASDKAISTVDPAGIALAAIQQLIRENEELKARIVKLEANQR